MKSICSKCPQWFYNIVSLSSLSFSLKVILGHTNTVELVQGHITGVNVYRSSFGKSGLDICTGNRGDVISWLEFDDCVKGDMSSFQGPSTCPTSSGNCCCCGYWWLLCYIIIRSYIYNRLIKVWPPNSSMPLLTNPFL